VIDNQLISEKHNSSTGFESPQHQKMDGKNGPNQKNQKMDGKKRPRPKEMKNPTTEAFKRVKKPIFQDRIKGVIKLKNHPTSEMIDELIKPFDTMEFKRFVKHLDTVKRPSN
jgi:hypothetical protein